MRGVLVIVTHSFNSSLDYFPYVFHFPTSDAAYSWRRLFESSLWDEGYGVEIRTFYDDPDEVLVDLGFLLEPDEEEDEEL